MINSPEGGPRIIHEIPADVSVDMAHAICWSDSGYDRLEGFDGYGKFVSQSPKAEIPVVDPSVVVKP